MATPANDINTFNQGKLHLSLYNLTWFFPPDMLVTFVVCDLVCKDKVNFSNNNMCVHTSCRGSRPSWALVGARCRVAKLYSLPVGSNWWGSLPSASVTHASLPLWTPLPLLEASNYIHCTKNHRRIDDFYVVRAFSYLLPFPLWHHDRMPKVQFWWCY